jgi:NTP pyrophosphatase (non-canonical NTP hydrolase)
MTPQEIEAVGQLLADQAGLDLGVAIAQVRNATLVPVPGATVSYSTLREANAARQVEYDPQKKLGLLYWSNALAGEVGELCNVVKKAEREKLGLPGSRSTRADIEEEIADVYIYLDLMCYRLNFDAGPAIKKKFNATSEKLGHKTRLG